MKMTRSAAASFLAAFMAWQPLSAQPANTGTSRSDQKTLMKNWALSICFAQITKDEQTKKDAGATARAFLENSHQDIEDFEQIGKLVDEFIAVKYGGSDGSDYNTMKCIDLFHSKKLDQLTSKLVKTGRFK